MSAIRRIYRFHLLGRMAALYGNQATSFCVTVQSHNIFFLCPLNSAKLKESFKSIAMIIVESAAWMQETIDTHFWYMWMCLQFHENHANV